jgi:sRNA-binding carbon storage regulator CsrA
MLILTRREGESLIIKPSPNVDPWTPVGGLLADGIEVRLPDCGRGKAKIGIDAPLDQAIVPAAPRPSYMRPA